MTVASFVAAQRTEHRVPPAKCCRWLGVSESWFYKWRDRPLTPRQARRAELDVAVKKSFDTSGGTPGTYGSPRVFEDLVEAGWKVLGEHGGCVDGPPRSSGARPETQAAFVDSSDKRRHRRCALVRRPD